MSRLSILICFFLVQCLESNAQGLETYDIKCLKSSNEDKKCFDSEIAFDDSLKYVFLMEGSSLYKGRLEDSQLVNVVKITQEKNTSKYFSRLLVNDGSIYLLYISPCIELQENPVSHFILEYNLDLEFKKSWEYKHHAPCGHFGFNFIKKLDSSTFIYGRSDQFFYDILSSNVYMVNRGSLDYPSCIVHPFEEFFSIINTLNKPEGRPKLTASNAYLLIHNGDKYLVSISTEMFRLYEVSTNTLPQVLFSSSEVKKFESPPKLHPNGIYWYTAGQVHFLSLN